jgi:nucleoside-diphosphate-sugar epimerase
MILVTGGTGFIGKSLVRHLVEIGRPVRILLRPSPHSPNLPKGVSVQVAVCSLRDERGLRAAMKDVDLIIHLAGGERLGSRSDLEGVDVDGTRTVAKVAGETGVKRLVYLSHLGADRASAYPVLKAKGISESYIQQSGVDFTILRTAPVYGPGDQFTISLVKLFRMAPGFFLLPGKGDTLLQPLSVGDLVVCLGLVIENPDFSNQLVSIGGSETFRFRQVAEMVMNACGYRRQIYSIGPAYLRYIALWIESLVPRFPLSLFWLDYLSVDRTCSLDVLPRQFGLIPARFGQMLGYLKTS